MCNSNKSVIDGVHLNRSFAPVSEMSRTIQSMLVSFPGVRTNPRKKSLWRDDFRLSSIIFCRYKSLNGRKFSQSSLSKFLSVDVNQSLSTPSHLIRDKAGTKRARRHVGSNQLMVAV